jgi:tRNA (guanine37-N1)-methyltransferase
MTWAATILTLCPEMFPGPLGLSLAGRALEQGTWSLDAIQIRDFATDKHKSVADTPAGGGCRTDAPLTATRALAGTFTWPCERGTLQGQLPLAPTDPPTIQALRLRAVPSP